MRPKGQIWFWLSTPVLVLMIAYVEIILRANKSIQVCIGVNLKKKVWNVFERFALTKSLFVRSTNRSASSSNKSSSNALLGSFEVLCKMYSPEINDKF